MAPPPAPPESLEVIAVLQALADPVRLDLVRQLSESDAPIACGRFDAPVAKSTLSHHFKILREAGVIATHRERGQALNVLRTAELEAAFPGLLGAVLPGVRAHVA
ncbi:transcriptional regulator, ArsR family [Actinomadura meyerae]|jgi:DNA-binding transcriptional ArsR family regulator|uniref:Transcriptional regulator, ArsR family n=1 Tax=Actinomadura meyerae TaxID=240840 RepID=A0A239CI16_9ACTN|nr:helix-turn-helix domain-containing protein [Actinomadura meyerae]SNS19562.1 transcriptional regulator, ArsR family [Actinomadura meyerae]